MRSASAAQRCRQFADLDQGIAPRSRCTGAAGGGHVRDARVLGGRQQGQRWRQRPLEPRYLGRRHGTRAGWGGCTKCSCTSAWAAACPQRRPGPRHTVTSASVKRSISPRTTVYAPWCRGPRGLPGGRVLPGRGAALPRAARGPRGRAWRPGGRTASTPPPPARQRKAKEWVWH
jgi:hypothetical protein